MAPILAYLMNKCAQSALRLVRRRVVRKAQQTLLPVLHLGWSCPDVVLQQLLGNEAGEGIRTLQGNLRSTHAVSHHWFPFQYC